MVHRSWRLARCGAAPEGGEDRGPDDKRTPEVRGSSQGDDATPEYLVESMVAAMRKKAKAALVRE